MVSRKITYCVIAGVVTIKLFTTLKKKWISYKLHKKALKKRAERDAKIPKIPEVEESKQEFILALSATELAREIREGRISSVEATATYISRSYKLGRQFNLTTEELFEEALELAYLRDLQLKENPESIGKLHGVPISFKDIFSQRNCTTSGGCAWRLDFPDTEDSFVVQTLKDEGAIPFVRTNVPQGIMAIESANEIYGRSDNPWDPDFTVGGSSGGEAGLIACRGSPIGIGNDIGGSVRIPASFCGVYGFKITPDRLSSKGVRNPHTLGLNPFYFQIRGACGPIGKCVDDLKLILEIWWQEKWSKYDFNYCLLPFSTQLYKEIYEKNSLRIGYFVDLKYFESCPALKRGLKECKEALEKQGHTLIEFKFPEIDQGGVLFTKVLQTCGSRFIEDYLNGETPESFYNVLFFLNNHPIWKRLILLLLKVTKNERLHELMSLKSNISASEYIDLYREITEFTRKFTDYWLSLNLDVVISPSFGSVALPHRESIKGIAGLAYSSLWNVIGYPAGVVPIGFVHEGETNYVSKHNDLITSRAREITKNTEGLPISVHVASLPYRDEIALGVMRKIEDIFKFHRHPI
ncbi:unnamed protein product [Blepharisma stoltei]|uniref:Amidase domain-containing protein n=1 Tax=Blepharisma stoltei TaxID=1481888 RepID=A0AAU9K896_9CILI|nr:unnamed protein product [Blepharisma stoltei]